MVQSKASNYSAETVGLKGAKGWDLGPTEPSKIMLSLQRERISHFCPRDHKMDEKGPKKDRLGQPWTPKRHPDGTQKQGRRAPWFEA